MENVNIIVVGKKIYNVFQLFGHFIRLNLKFHSGNCLHVKMSRTGLFLLCIPAQKKYLVTLSRTLGMTFSMNFLQIDYISSHFT